MNKRWLLSRDGQKFVRLVAEELRSTREDLKKSSAAAGDRGPASGTDTSGQLSDRTLGNVEDDWELAKTDFIDGVEAIIARNLTAAEEEPFRVRLHDHYWLRFRDGYDTMDLGAVRAQALALGHFTGNMYRLHKGEIGPYPGADPNVTLSVFHLEWAREYLGFYFQAKVRWPHDEPRPERFRLESGLGLEFENGCVLC